MKVVLFCGGMGMRLREYSDMPKPLVAVGKHPILWHLMQYYTFYGHREFILCLGYKAEEFAEYFLNCGARITGDTMLSPTMRRLQLVFASGLQWDITLADTGLHANIGQRLKAVEPLLRKEDVFLANYADALTDLPLPQVIDYFQRKNVVAAFVAVHPAQTFHVIAAGADGFVQNLHDVHESDLWVNGGYFVFRRSIFSYIEAGEELIIEPFRRLIAERKLATYKYSGFWACMDTFKEKQQLDELCAKSAGPWEAWEQVRELGALETPVLGRPVAACS